MKRLLLIEAALLETPEGKVTWEFKITEDQFGTDAVNNSVKDFDTEEEASANLIRTLKYVLAGEA